MAGYVVVQLQVQDPEKFAKYREQVAPTIEQFGGRYVVRGGSMDRIEGDWPYERLVIVEFDSVDQARAWYDSEEYKAPKALRLSASVSNAVIVEGV